LGGQIRKGPVSQIRMAGSVRERPGIIIANLQQRQEDMI